MPLGSRASATVLATRTLSITGMVYVRVSVSSNIITASDTVVRVTPDNAAAAPTIPYSPGMTQWLLSPQEENTGAAGQRHRAYCMANPTIRPAHAPTPRVGIKIPAGTLMPNVTTVRAALTTSATAIIRITENVCVPGSSTQRPAWVLGEPGRHMAKRL